MMRFHRRWSALALGVAAVIAVLLGSSRPATAQTITEFPIPTPNGMPGSITLGPDGALWFTFNFNNSLNGQIGRITTAGSITTFSVSSENDITTGPDGALWFTEPGGNYTPDGSAEIGRITTSGTITQFPLPAVGNSPGNVTFGPDGALWFDLYYGNFGVTGTDVIGRMTTAGAVTQYPLSVPTGCYIVAGIGNITPGPDGALWFAVPYENLSGNGCADYIGRITTSGTITEYPLQTPGSGPFGITTGPDGALWFTEDGGGEACGPSTCVATAPFPGIGRITTSGTITEYPLPNPLDTPGMIAVGPDGALWFTESGSCAYPNPNNCVSLAPDKIGRITTSGALTEYPISTANAGTFGIAAGPDGAMWFTESNNNEIGRITVPANSIATLTVSQTGSGLVLSSPIGISCPSTCSAIFVPGTQVSLTAEPANGFAFTGWGGACGGVGTCTVAMSAAQSVSANFAQTTPPSSPLVAAVLPSSRSVELGNTATAFATIINAGTTTVPGCSITPATALPIDFLYQTTNPTTNALAGTANTPADILAGQFQSFVIALTPTAAFNPTNIPFSFACNNVAQAPSQTGLNTLLLSASGTPVPDVVALAATPKGDGILHIPGTTGSAAFAVATVNLGSSATITATANSGSAILPVALTICQTNPQTGQCLVLPPTPSVTTTINADATPTFSIFATASGSVPFLPAANRIFVQFSDAGGVVRGSTSVAVVTQ
jgi:streptogramin lyase